jgi:hypothetical protein
MTATVIDPSPNGGGPASRSSFLLVCLIAATPILIKLFCYRDYPGSDDAFIHLRLVDNLTRGLGWGINPHEPVNMSSSPLYTVLLALLSLAGVPSLLGGECLSAVSGFFCNFLLHGLLVRMGLRPVACLAGATVAAFNIYLWRWNGVVMETTMGLCLLTLAYWLYHGADELPAGDARPAWRYLLAGAAVGLGTLTRFELALVVGCFGLCEMCNRPPARWLVSCCWLSAGFLVAIAPWFIFSWFYFHALLPTTFYAKTQSGLLLWNRAVLTDVAKLVIASNGIPILGVLLLGVAVWRQKRLALAQTILRRLDVFLFPLLLVLFHYLKSASLQSAARYLVPALHLLPVGLACLLEAWSRHVPARPLRLGLGGALALQIVAALAINQMQIAPVLSRFRENYWSTAREAAEFLKSQAPPGRTPRVLVVEDIGMLSYYAGDACYFVDGGGLATPTLLRQPLQKQLELGQPDLVAETLGRTVGGMSAEAPALRLLWHRTFRSHSLSYPTRDYTLNIYENPER